MKKDQLTKKIREVEQQREDEKKRISELEQKNKEFSQQTAAQQASNQGKVEQLSKKIKDLEEQITIKSKQISDGEGKLRRAEQEVSKAKRELEKRTDLPPDFFALLQAQGVIIKHHIHDVIDHIIPWVHDKWENHLKPTYHQGVKNYHEHIHPHVKDTFEHVRRESEPYIAQFDEHVAGTVEDILHEHVVPQVKQVAPEHAHYITPHTREIAYAIIIFPTIIITLVFWYVVCVAIFPRKKKKP